MKNFSQFGLQNSLLKALERMQLTTPTPIQDATIPLALSGLDILASAQTGSGKTIAYLLPLIHKLLHHQEHCALVLTPTRELATQVHTVLNQVLAGTNPFKTALLIGGAPMNKQINALRRNPRLIVGTPGRINDHLSSGNMRLHNTRFLIVDEADRMLDMGFSVQLDQIAEYLPEVRQTLMFSATFPPNIERLSQKHLKNPHRITIASHGENAPKIDHQILRTKGSEKFNELLKQLEQREGSVIIFVKTKRGADNLSRKLKDHGQHASAIHGDLSQSRRDKVIQSLRNNMTRIMVATDVAARGLDIPHIMHVINYDLPQCPEDYVHRVGRTGRAGAEGHALCFICPEDNQKWRAIAKLMNFPREERRPERREETPQPTREPAEKPVFKTLKDKKRDFRKAFPKQKSFSNKTPKRPYPGLRDFAEQRKPERAFKQREEFNSEDSFSDGEAPKKKFFPSKKPFFKKKPPFKFHSKRPHN